jgi:hypothetical protein
VAVALDRHAIAFGWDAPPRLYALVSTGALLAAEPQLRARADLAEAAPDTLTPVEQDPLPRAATLTEALARVVWPPQVDGAALVVEQVVLPPEVERQLPAEPEQARDWAAHHPAHDDVRITVAVLRDGRSATVLRLRSHDDDSQVLRGPNLVPELTRGLAATLRP